MYRQTTLTPPLKTFERDYSDDFDPEKHITKSLEDCRAYYNNLTAYVQRKQEEWTALLHSQRDADSSEATYLGNLVPKLQNKQKGLQTWMEILETSHGPRYLLLDRYHRRRREQKELEAKGVASKSLYRSPSAVLPPSHSQQPLKKSKAFIPTPMFVPASEFKRQEELSQSGETSSQSSSGSMQDGKTTDSGTSSPPKSFSSTLTEMTKSVLSDDEEETFEFNPKGV